MMQNDFGLISIIMAAYNAEQTIEQAINSVLSQTYTNFELIVGGGIVFAVHLRITGQASLCLKPQRKFRHLLAILDGDLRAFRAGTHNGQITF